MAEVTTAPVRPAPTASEALRLLAVEVSHHPDQRLWTSTEVVALLTQAAASCVVAEEAARG